MVTVDAQHMMTWPWPEIASGIAGGLSALLAYGVVALFDRRRVRLRRANLRNRLLR